jgi:hypothetical protein
MRQKRKLVLVEFVTADGVRMEYGDEGWKIHNIRQLGEVAKQGALDLLVKAEETTNTVPEDLIGDDPLWSRAEYAAKRLKLRITHRRHKQIDGHLRPR